MSGRKPKRESIKPPRQRVEFFLPRALATEIKDRAELAGVTQTILLMDLLKNAGFKVLDSDYIDKRTLPRYRW